MVVGALVLVGCGEAPPPEIDEPVQAPTVVEIQLTFHRAEEPVPVLRRVELPREEGSEEAVEARLSAALEALISGPSAAERDQGLHSLFSADTRGILASVEVEDGLAVVDFHDFRALIPNASSSAGSFAFLAELNGTVFANAPVREVEYRIEGDCDAFWAFLQRDCTVVPRPESA
jgi:spore germination protein GerM